MGVDQIRMRYWDVSSQFAERESSELCGKPFDVGCYSSADLLTEVKRWREESKKWDWRSTPVTDHEIATLAVESWLGVDRIADIVKSADEIESGKHLGHSREH